MDLDDIACTQSTFREESSGEEDNLIPLKDAGDVQLESDVQSSEDDLLLIKSLETFEKSQTTRLQICGDEEIAKKSVRSLAQNTEKKIKWAVNIFETWKAERNKIARTDPSISIIDSELNYMTTDELNFCISRLICEMKKVNGEEYPAQTLYEIVIQLQLFFEQRGKYFKFLSDDEFMQVRNTLDHVMKERSSSGIGTEKRKALIITESEENMLWEKGVLGVDTPRKLLDSLVYLVGLNFAFRAGQEHRNLRWNNPQLTLVQSEDGTEILRYREDVSKTNQGGLKSRKIKQKVVYAFPNKVKPERCLIRIFKLYVQHCPDEKSAMAFYLRPLGKPKGDIWFSSAPIGINQLRGTVTKLCAEAGLQGHRTNHSLRATAATRLYRAGVDEQLVCEVTGHKSEAVRDYKRTDETMRKRVSNVINCSETQPCEKASRSSDGLNITISLNVK